MKLPAPTWLTKKPSRWFPRLPKRRMSRVFVAACMAAVLGGATAVTVHHANALPDDAAFRVGDRVVTEEELRDRIKVVEALYGIQQPDDSNKADVFRRDSAKAIATSMVLDQAARDRNILIADKAARDALTKLIDDRFGGDRDAFVKLLGEVGASERDVIDEIKRQRITARLWRDVTQHVDKVAHTEVKRAFQERRKSLVTLEKRRIRNIVVATREDADLALRQARSGTAFGNIVKQMSLDQSTRSKNGELGFVAREQLDDKYAKEAFGTAKNSFFGPVKTQYGWNVGQVLAVRPSRPLKFKEVERDLRTTLMSEKALNAWNHWLEKEIKRSDVEYADKYRPADPYGPPTTKPKLRGQERNAPR